MGLLGGFGCGYGCGWEKSCLIGAGVGAGTVGGWRKPLSMIGLIVDVVVVVVE